MRSSANRRSLRPPRDHAPATVPEAPAAGYYGSLACCINDEHALPASSDEAIRRASPRASQYTHSPRVATKLRPARVFHRHPRPGTVRKSSRRGPITTNDDAPATHHAPGRNAPPPPQCTPPEGRAPSRPDPMAPGGTRSVASPTARPVARPRRSGALRAVAGRVSHHHVTVQPGPASSVLRARPGRSRPECQEPPSGCPLPPEQPRGASRRILPSGRGSHRPCS